MNTPPTSPTPASSPKTNSRIWGGDQLSYCYLRFDEYLKQGLMDPILDPAEQIEIAEHATQYSKDKKYQEALWAEHLSNHLEDRDTLRAKIEEIMSEDPIEVIPLKLGGTTSEMLLRFRDGVEALFKPEPPVEIRRRWENSTSEAAAYKLDRILNLNIVPVTLYIDVKIPGGNTERGSLQYWVNENIRNGKPTDIPAMDFTQMKVLDYLSGNQDRKAENFLIWKDYNRVVAIDNGESFDNRGCGNSSDIINFLELDRHLLHQISSMKSTEIRNELKHILTIEQIDRIISRLEGLKKSLKEEGLL